MALTCSLLTAGQQRAFEIVLVDDLSRQGLPSTPREWVEERLTQLQDVLERNPDRSALILRNFLGPLRLDPTRGETGRPYYTIILGSRG